MSVLGVTGTTSEAKTSNGIRSNYVGGDWNDVMFPFE